MMNKLFRQIIQAILLLCVILLISPPLQAAAGNMQWTTVTTPDVTDNVITSPSEINFIALSADNRTLFASDTANSKFYRSPDSGQSWRDISSLLTDAGAALPVWNIVTAPDNPSIVAVVASSGGLPRTVFLSTDGGNNWNDLGFTGTASICAVTISPFYGKYDLAVGTRNSTGGGKLMIFQVGSTGSWADQGLSGDILALCFSPNYSSDNSLVLAMADNTGSYVYTAFRDVAANTSSFGISPPVEITTAGAGTSPKAGQIISSDIELPSDFLGGTPSMRKIFITTDDAVATGNAGIFRIDDNLIYRIFQPSGSIRISSIAYYGSASSGKLLAGEVKSNPAAATVDIWYSSNATASCPLANCIIWQKAAKPPTGGANSGNANAQVYWSRDGAGAYCTTSSADIASAGWPNGYLIGQALDETAFSLSLDNGNTWNQLSLIDSRIDYLADVLPTFNSQTIYLASVNTTAGPNGFDSIWKSNDYPQFKKWERMMCFLAGGNEIILRMNTARPNEVFISPLNTDNVYYSNNSGQTWSRLAPNINLKDFSISEINTHPVITALSDTTVRIGQYSGSSWQWGMPVNTGLTSGHSITATPAGIVLIGDAGQGGVAVSADSGATFNLLPYLPVSGRVNVILDSRVRDPYLIHAATDNPSSNIYSWILGASTRWLDMGAPASQYYGLAQMNTFYGLWSDAGGSGAVRTLQPERIGPPFIEWDTMQAGLSPGVTFSRGPAALKTSAGVNLWAIDNRTYTSATGRLWQYCDCLSGGPPVITLPDREILIQAPLIISPQAGTFISLDEPGSKVPAIEFHWQHATAANGYDLIIAADNDFTQIIVEESIRPENVSAPEWTLPAHNSPLEAGKTYYWKVRVNRIAYTYQKASGEWSESMQFSIAPSKTTEIPQTGIVLLSPADGGVITENPPVFKWSSLPEISTYEFMLASDPAMEQILHKALVQDNSYTYSGQIEEGMTYYWQVTPLGNVSAMASPVYRFNVPQTGKGTLPEDSRPWLYIAIPLLAFILAIIAVLVISRSRSRKANQ
jgi:hypothetical protein